MDDLLSLRELCNAVGITRRSVQCYEKVGLIKPTSKNKYGYLLYNKETVERAKRIRFLQETGFLLRDIRQIIDAPPDMFKNALQKRVQELIRNRESIDKLICSANELIQSLQE